MAKFGLLRMQHFKPKSLLPVIPVLLEDTQVLLLPTTDLKALCLERYETRCGILYQTMLCLPTIQTLKPSSIELTPAPTNSRGCMEGFVHGLYRRITQILGLQCHFGGGGQAY